MIKLVTILSSLFFSSVYASEAVDAFDRGDYANAKSLFRTHTDKAESNLYLGRMAFNENDLDLAEIYLEKAITARPNHAEYHFWFAMMSARQAGSASIFSALGYATDARNHYERALVIEPTHFGALRGLTEFYANAPSFGGGDIDKAYEMLERLYEADPLEGFSIHMDILRKEDKTHEALKLADEMAARHNGSSRVLTKVGFAYQNAEQYGKAMELFEQAAALEPDDSNKSSSRSALYQIGKTAMLSNNFTERGITALEEYIRINKDPGETPSTNWARYRLASLYLINGESAKALKLATIAATDSNDRLSDNAIKLVRKLSN